MTALEYAATAASAGLMVSAIYSKSVESDYHYSRTPRPYDPNKRTSDTYENASPWRVGIKRRK